MVATEKTTTAKEFITMSFAEVYLEIGFKREWLNEMITVSIYNNPKLKIEIVKEILPSGPTYFG